MNRINIEETMAILKNELQKKTEAENRYDSMVGQMDGMYKTFDYAEYVGEIDKLNYHRQINAYWELKSTRKVLGGVAVFFKKVIRRLTSFYVEPIVEEQNKVNEIVTNIAIMSVRDSVQAQQQIDYLKARVYELEKIVGRLGAK